MNAQELEIFLKPYELEVTQLQKVGVNCTTTHPRSGAAAIDNIGTWDRNGKVGDGGFGVVFLEQNTSTGALRAVKMLTRGSDSDQYREIQVMLFVKQYERQFVGFHAWYEHGDVKYISMEYVSGGDLMGHVRDVGALAEVEARAIAEQILQALFILHEHSLTHRDIKPENILIVGTAPVHIKVADFGQTKELNGAYQTPTGTWDWAAPEQKSPNYGQSVDMWAVGCVVYFLLTSLNPFVTNDDKSPPSMVKQHTFPSWPRLPRHRFQERPNRLIPGDQILVRDVSNAANDFLNKLIVREPTGRMTVHRALWHSWIYDTPPLESALQYGDLRLSRLLARHDLRYNNVWDDPLPEATWLVILRFAAANGHLDLVSRALESLPPHYTFTCDLRDWPDLPPALVGAARSGHCDIVNLLLNSTRLATEETSGPSMEQAIWAALVAGKQRVISTLGHRILPSVSSKRQLSRYIAAYGNSEMLLTAIEVYKQPHVLDSHGVYRHCFPTMLLATARVGNIENLRYLLSDPPSWPMSIDHNVLQMAVRRGHCDIVQLLLQHYPREAEDSPTCTQILLHTAAHYGHLVVVQFLLNHGARPSRRAIDIAVSQNNNAVFQLLINALIRDDSPQSIDLAHQSVLGAITHCDLRLLRWLHTPSPNPVEDVRKAAGFGDLAVVKYLLYQAPPYSPPQILLAAALVGAAEVGGVHIVGYLLTQDIDISAADPWLAAATNGHAAVLELLLKCSIPEREVLTQAVRLAARANHLSVVVLLMHHGAVWNGDCEPVVRAVVSAFRQGGELPEIGAPASRRR